MHEEVKLLEAKFFYDQMVAYQTKSIEFRYNLSAFLSASRSVLLYAFEEIKSIPARKRWYDTYIPAHPPLGFFKDKRNINIHDRPISLNLHVTFTESVSLSSSITIIHRDKEGNIINQETVNDKPTEQKTASKIPPQIQFFFTDWTGTQDVFALSQLYLVELKKFIQEAKQLGYITA